MQRALVAPSSYSTSNWSIIMSPKASEETPTFMNAGMSLSSTVYGTEIRLFLGVLNRNG